MFRRYNPLRWLLALKYRLDVKDIDEAIVAELKYHAAHEQRLAAWRAYRQQQLSKYMHHKGEATGSVVWSLMGKTPSLNRRSK